MQHLLSYLTASPYLHKNDIDYIIKQSKIRYVKKNCVISKVGNFENYINSIKAGMIRNTLILPPGAIITTHCMTKGETAYYSLSFHNGSKAACDILAIENTRLLPEANFSLTRDIRPGPVFYVKLSG